MSILATSGSSSNPYLSYLQSLQTSAAAEAQAASAAGSNSSSTQQTSAPATSQSTSVTSSGATSLVQQLQTAIQNALTGVNASQMNVDPQQFQSDLFSALSNSQDGSLNQSQVFQSLPAGQNLNVLA